MITTHLQGSDITICNEQCHALRAPSAIRIRVKDFSHRIRRKWLENKVFSDQY